MLVYLPPTEDMLPALADYRMECGEDCDGTAGLGSFPDPASWLERVRLLASPEAERKGWFRTEVFLAFEMPEVCSLGAKTARESGSGLLPGMRLVGIGNVRLSHDPVIEERAGHIGYHVRPSARGRGIGTAVLSHAVALCRERGFETPVLSVEPDNLSSLRTALRCGFCSPEKQILGDGSRILLLKYGGAEG